MRTLFICGLVMIGSVSYQNSRAEEPVQGSEIVVTATRTAQTADETLASVSTISRKDIENSQAATITELLRLETGVDITRTGGPGQQTSLFLRGGNSDHALVLIDGVRVSSGTTGSFPWEKISLEQIERIEIVRGPRSVLYGSDAIGGVIQIFTRRSDRVSSRFEAGSFGTHGGSVASSFGNKLKVYLSADYRAAEGFSATNPNSGGSYDADKDGYDTRGINLGAHSRLSNKSHVDFSFWNTRANDEFDSGTHKSTNQAVNLRLSTEQNENWSHILTLGNVVDDLITAGGSPSHIITRRDVAEWQHDLLIGNSTKLTTGLSYAKENASNNAAPFNNQIFNTGAFADWRHTAGANKLELGLRIDSHSEFGQYNTGQIAWGRKFGSKWNVFASHGTAYKAPDQNELYHPGYGGGSYAGNSALQPETSISTEVGLRFRKSKNISLKASVYHTDVTNLIASEGMNNQSINIGSARLQGIEAEYAHRLGNWDTRTNLTFQSTKNAIANTDLLRRPATKVSLSLNRHLKRGGNFGIEVLAFSNHADFSNITYKTIDVPGYTVVNLSLRRPLSKHWVLEGRLENLFDSKYEIVSGYNTVPRSVLVAARYVTSD